MKSVDPIEAIDDAQCVKTAEMDFTDVVMVWYGGAVVRTFTVVPNDGWYESDEWEIGTDKTSEVVESMLEEQVETLEAGGQR